MAYLFARQVTRYTSGIAGERVLPLRAWAGGTVVNLVLSVTELLLAQPEIGAVVAVALYAVAVGVFAPRQFIFSDRMPRVPVEELPLDRPSRAGLVVTALTAVAMLILAGAGGVRLG